MAIDVLTEDASDEDVIAAIEDNAVAGVKAWAAWPEIELHEGPALAWTISDIAFPFFNSFLRPRLSAADVEGSIAASKARAAERSVPISWWLGPVAEPADLGDRLAANGFMAISEPAGMAMRMDALTEVRAAPAGVLIEEVTGDDAVAHWSAVVADVNGFPALAQDALRDMHCAAGLGPGNPWRHFLAWSGDRPVGASSLFVGAGVAGVANVSVVRTHRRLGIGTVLTTVPFQIARTAGYRIGTLWASAEGEALYRKLGFREYCRGPVYMWAPQ